MLVAWLRQGRSDSHLTCGTRIWTDDPFCPTICCANIAQSHWTAEAPIPSSVSGRAGSSRVLCLFLILRICTEGEPGRKRDKYNQKQNLPALGSWASSFKKQGELYAYLLLKPPTLWAYMHSPPSFYGHLGILNSDPHDCKAKALPIKLSPAPQFSILLKLFYK